ncbi:MAG: M56 family metallopeptidase [Lachnospiraceae bacterium]|nr:M56 family metallopeptidase [Lachnospiraceae bacterium]
MEIIMDNLTRFFQTIISLSIVGSYVILLILIVRCILCKAPRWCCYMLWGIVFVRLICPVFPQGKFSLIPNQLQMNIEEAQSMFFAGEGEVLAAFQGGYTIQDTNINGLIVQSGSPQLTQYAPTNGLIVQSGSPQLTQYAPTNGLIVQSGSQLPTQNANKNSILGHLGLVSAQSEQAQKSSNIEQNQATTGAGDVHGLPQEKQKEKLISIFSVFWLIGVVLLMGYHSFSYWQLKKRVKSAILTQEGVYEVQGEHLSFVLGILRPAIYLSAGLKEERRRVILCHERVHLHRRDYLIKPVALGICCIHWFNPLVWVAFCLMCRDCEMSCDERVVALLGEESKKTYSYALLDEATKGERRSYRKGGVCALLSFGEDSVKARIQHVLKYQKASIWLVAGVVVVLGALAVGLCSNPKKQLLTEQQAVNKVLAAGGYPEDSVTVCFLRDYEGDNKPEAFVEIGTKGMNGQQINGDLWLVSEKGETTQILKKKLFAMEQEIYEASDKGFILVSYVVGDSILTEMYGVRDGKAEQVIGGNEQKYIEKDMIVCVQTDNRLAYDVGMQAFSGKGQKKYAYYYEAPYFNPYTGFELSKEEFTKGYDNGVEIIAELEDLFPEGHFQYIARENGWVHINVAYEKSNYDNVIYFWNVTYQHNTEAGANELVALESGDGCYKRNMQAAGEVPFVEEIAKKYGWQMDNPLVTSMMTPEAALDTFAFAYQHRNGDTLYQLSHDKDNFESWDKVTPLAEGGYAFGDSSPWVSHYSIDYLPGQEEATIRFFLENSIPEVYIAEETVRVVKDGVLYYVDHVNYVEYDSIDNREEARQVYHIEREDYLNNPFHSESTGYTWAHTRNIFMHVLNGTNPEYYNRYTDPVTAARTYLHLGEGSGEVTEIKYGTRPWNLYSSGYGEGTIVNVRYTFAEDGSTMDIPMTLAEESMGIWTLCFSSDQRIEERATEKHGWAAWQNQTIIASSNARMIYDVCMSGDGDYPSYQASSYGLYCNDEAGLTCIYPCYMPPSTKLEYYDGKLYFPTDSQYEEGALDYMYESICVFDLVTGETSLLALPENIQRMFPLDWFAISEGFIIFSSADSNDTCEILLEDLDPVWQAKE